MMQNSCSFSRRRLSRFGNDRINDLYPIVFLVYGASGAIGPWAGGRIFDLTGSYESALWICIAIALPSALIAAGLFMQEIAKDN